jgi:hypothetical protein
LVALNICKIHVPPSSHNWNISILWKTKCDYNRLYSSCHWSRNNLFCLFVCLFWVAQAIFQLSGNCHHYRWQGCKEQGTVSAKFCPAMEIPKNVIIWYLRMCIFQKLSSLFIILNTNCNTLSVKPYVQTLTSPFWRTFAMVLPQTLHR